MKQRNRSSNRITFNVDKACVSQGVHERGRCDLPAMELARFSAKKSLPFVMRHFGNKKTAATRLKEGENFLSKSFLVVNIFEHAGREEKVVSPFLLARRSFSEGGTPIKNIAFVVL